MNQRTVAVKQYMTGDDGAASETGLTLANLKIVREAFRLFLSDGELTRLNNEKIQEIAEDRRRTVLKAAKELYPDRNEIPSTEALAKHTTLSLNAVKSAVSSLKRLKRWDWRQPIDRKKLGLASASPYKKQAFPVAVNMFVRDYAKGNKGNLPDVPTIAKTLGRSEKFTAETVRKMKENGKWPVKNWE